MSKPTLVFSPLTRWVLAWPDGQHVRRASIDEEGPLLFRSRKLALQDAEHWTFQRPTPVKVRVTIEVAK